MSAESSLASFSSAPEAIGAGEPQPIPREGGRSLERSDDSSDHSECDDEAHDAPDMNEEERGDEQRRKRRRPGRRQRARNKRPTESGVSSSSVGLESFVHRSDKLTEEDIHAISRQLGYIPRNIIEVAYRNKETGEPIVALLYGISRGKLNRIGDEDATSDTAVKPFPTIYWMTCPDVRKKISVLEDSGMVAKYQKELMASDDHLEAMRRAHSAYESQRWNTLLESDKEILRKNGWEYAYNGVGVAGIRGHQNVKCLHCHTAHYLGRPEDGNCVGQWVAELLGL